MTPPTGLTRDAGWQIGVSRTLPQPPEEVWDFLTGPEGMTLWLGEATPLETRRGAPYALTDGTTGEVRGYRAGIRIRLTHRPAGQGHETTLQFTLTPHRGGTLLQFHQERLAGPAEREERRRHWRTVTDAVSAALSPSP